MIAEVMGAGGPQDFRDHENVPERSPAERFTRLIHLARLTRPANWHRPAPGFLITEVMGAETPKSAAIMDPCGRPGLAGGY